ncbi:MAG: hypothetical protein ACLQU3_29965 [Limisphaerales bacterium]
MKASLGLLGPSDTEGAGGAWWWPVLCLTLAVTVLAARLAGPGSLTRKLFPAADLAAGPPLLDSFSEPAVACAILKEESLRLWWTVQVEAAEEEEQAPPGQRGRVATETSTHSLMSLAGQVQELALDLNQQVMELELKNHAWDEFLDRYLSLLYEAPYRTEASSWAQCALELAQKCDRAEEAESALRRVVRLRRPPHTAAKMEAALDAWQTQRSSGNHVNGR